MTKFNVSKVVSAADLSNLVATLNDHTHDGYIAGQTRIGRKRWLLRIKCSHRDDATLIRAL